MRDVDLFDGVIPVVHGARDPDHDTSGAQMKQGVLGEPHQAGIAAVQADVAQAACMVSHNDAALNGPLSALASV